jgi:hypothetical protein
MLFYFSKLPKESFAKQSLAHMYFFYTPLKQKQSIRTSPIPVTETYYQLIHSFQLNQFSIPQSELITEVKQSLNKQKTASMRYKL